VTASSWPGPGRQVCIQAGVRWQRLALRDARPA